MKYKVSVIVPIFNSDKYLERCLESLVNQTYKNIEIILVNDGSTDDSEKICKKYLGDNIKYIYKVNQGVSSARNEGLKYVSGQFIIFIDADDYLEKNGIELAINSIIENELDICIFNYKKIKENQEILNYQSSEYGNRVIDKDEFIEGLFCPNGYKGYLWNKVIKYSLIKDFRFDNSLHIMEDLVFLCSIAENANKILYLENQYMYNYVIHSNSALNSSMNKKTISCLNAYEKLLIYVRKYGIKYLYNFEFSYLFFAMKSICFLKQAGLWDKEYKKKMKKIKKMCFRNSLKCKERTFKEKIQLIFVVCFPVGYGFLKKIKRRD